MTEILQELFDTYGAIPQSLTAVKDNLEATVYNHDKPVVTIFTAINEYASMADAANASETDDQLVNIGQIVISRATIFSGDVRKLGMRNLALIVPGPTSRLTARTRKRPSSAASLP